MGCGNSKLAGPAIADIGSEQPIPVKKVATTRSQFNDIDYSHPKDPTKGDYPRDRAPDEVDEPEPPEVRHHPHHRDNSFVRDNAASGKQHESGMVLEPYHTIEGEEEEPEMYPHEKLGMRNAGKHSRPDPDDPTTDASKQEFADQNSYQPEGEGRKKSLFSKITDGDGRKYSEPREKRGQKYTDEELFKYAGMNNAELQRRAQDAPNRLDSQGAFGSPGMGPMGIS